MVAVRPKVIKTNPLRTTFVVGTRPEAIKLAPVILGAQADPKRFKVSVISTGQHGKMLSQALGVFGIEADHNLSVLRQGQSLCELTSRIVTKLDKVLKSKSADVLVVHGDTTTAMAAALASTFHNIPVAHIEAGLRAYGEFSPFPEETNRRVISHMADIHFAPTTTAVQNLVREGINISRIVCTGNTVIDALTIASKNHAIPKVIADLPEDKKIILVTAHRRENLGDPLRDICTAVANIAKRHKEVLIVWPMHKNPLVRGTVQEHLSGLDNVRLLEPLDYMAFIQLMKKAYLILTDSGGIQEEAPALGKPVLIMRKSTERPEALECRSAKIVGTSPEMIQDETERLLENDVAYKMMSTVNTPFGDGKSSARILDSLYNKYSEAGTFNALGKVLLFAERASVATAVDALKAFKRKKEAESIGRSFTAVQDWLLNSGVQARTGAIYSWYNPSKNSYAFIYPEIMGYWMTAMCALAESEPLGERTDIFMNSARQAGDWLMQKGFRDCGAVPSRFYERGRGKDDPFHSNHGLIATFDNGIILNGFLNLYEKTLDQKYLTAAETIASFILTKMAPPGERIQALYSCQEDKYLEYNDRWSCSPGSFLSKVAIAMLHMHKIKADPAYSDCAVHLCANALKYQDKDTGRFMLPDGSTYTHPHCYSSEGLLSAGTLLSEEEYVDAGIEGTRWLLQQAEKEGYVRRNYESNIGFPRAVSSDIQAQSIRLFYIAKEACPDMIRFAPASKNLLSFMLSHQNWDEANPKIHGGFRYGTSTEDGSNIDTYNSWASMFAMQAMMFCRKGMTGYTPFMLV